MLSRSNNPFAAPAPWSWFHPRCRAPLAHRLGAIAEYRLSRHRQERLGAKENSGLNYVTMAARAHWLLLRESLVSQHRAWQALPKLTVVSDGSWQRSEFAEAFNFWPNPIRILMPGDILEPLAQSGQTALVQLARAHPLGLKLAAIILSAQQEATLFVDSDILWFSEPPEILRKFNGVAGPRATVETGCSCNEALVRRFCPQGLSAPGVNTGCVYLEGALCDGPLLRDLLAAALENPGHNFNEQTIIAIAIQANGGKLPAEFCLVDFADALTVSRRQPWREGYHARHYVNWMRHQFFRDAGKLRRMTPGQRPKS